MVVIPDLCFSAPVRRGLLDDVAHVRDLVGDFDQRGPVAVVRSMRDLRILGRNTQGVKLANLKENDILVAIQKLQNGEEKETAEEVSPIEVP